MSWFKVDDGSAFNSKVLAAKNEGWGAFCRVGAWCAQQLTDGRFSRAIALTIAPMRVWTKLIEVGLVDSLEKGEMQVHDYLQRNPSKEQVLAERDQMRRRVARFRNGTNKDIFSRDSYQCRYCGTGKGPFSVDHVEPVSKGGTDDETNLVTACVACNSRKKDHSLADVGMTLRSVPNGRGNALQTVTETIPRPVPSRPDLSPERGARPESDEPRSGVHQSAPPVAMPANDRPETGYDLAYRLWHELWSAKYRRPYEQSGTRLMGPGSEESVLVDVGGRALIRGDRAEAYLRHKIAAYLRDEGDRKWLVEHCHPLRTLTRDWAKYGDPKPPARMVPRRVEEPVSAERQAEFAKQVAAVGRGGSNG